MNHNYLAKLIAFVIALFTVDTMAAEASRPTTSPDDAKLIASAETAAPAKVSKAATIVVMDAAGKLRTTGASRD